MSINIKRYFNKTILLYILQILPFGIGIGILWMGAYNFIHPRNADLIIDETLVNIFILIISIMPFLGVLIQNQYIHNINCKNISIIIQIISNILCIYFIILGSIGGVHGIGGSGIMIWGIYLVVLVVLGILQIIGKYQTIKNN